jgi:S1-C subfamily serine protease
VKRILQLVAVCLFGLLLIRGHADDSRAQEAPSTQNALPLSALIDLVRPMVVQVVVRVRGETPSQFDACFNGHSSCIAGTGFFINSDGFIVTAFHVLEGYDSHPGIKEVIAAVSQIGSQALIQIGVAIPNVENQYITAASGTTYFDAKVVATDPAHDLALIQATVNPFTHMPQSYGGLGARGMPQAMAKAVTISTTRPKDGEAIFGCGYPLGSYGLVSTAGNIASAWNNTVLVRAAAAGFSNPVGVYEVDLKTNFGDSGGPVFRTSDQAVIGVDVQTFGSLAIAVPAKFVSAFLDANKISWQPTSRP